MRLERYATVRGAGLSDAGPLGAGMAGRPGLLEELTVLRRLAPTLILLSTAMPLAARAQVNIDQDKTPAHIFSSDCAVCHKSTRGLANGRGSSELTGFLAEHYTSSREEAAAVAAYVLAGGGGVGRAAPAREEAPAAEEGRTPAEQPKTREARRSAKPGEEPATSGKPERTANERRRRGQRTATAEPGGVGSETKPAAEEHEPSPAARAHGRQEPPENASPTPVPEPKPAAVAATPGPTEPIKPENAAPTSAPSAAPPQQAEPAAAPSGGRDNIPD
jgi:hypothetical protein